jgi:hypothetical protein
VATVRTDAAKKKAACPDRLRWLAFAALSKASKTSAGMLIVTILFSVFRPGSAFMRATVAIVPTDVKHIF